MKPINIFIHPDSKIDLDRLYHILDAIRLGRRITYQGRILPTRYIDPTAFVPNLYSVNVVFTNSRSLHNINEFGIAPLRLPDPPEGEEWHNPANLTPDQIEVEKGYRLLLKSEIGGKPTSQPLEGKCDAFLYGKYWEDENEGYDEVLTYRTKVPLPVKKIKTTYEYVYE